MYQESSTCQTKFFASNNRRWADAALRWGAGTVRRTPGVRLLATARAVSRVLSTFSKERIMRGMDPRMV